MSDERRAEYEALLHAVQTGVMYELEYDKREHPTDLDENAMRLIKHLRVGNNARARDHASLVKLLLGKSLITEDEYYAALVEGVKEEVAMYEAMLSAKIGGDIKLG